MICAPLWSFVGYKGLLVKVTQHRSHTPGANIGVKIVQPRLVCQIWRNRTHSRTSGPYFVKIDNFLHFGVFSGTKIHKNGPFTRKKPRKTVRSNRDYVVIFRCTYKKGRISLPLNFGNENLQKHLLQIPALKSKIQCCFWEQLQI